MVIFGWRITWRGFFAREPEPYLGYCCRVIGRNERNGCSVLGCGYPKEPCAAQRREELDFYA